MATVTIDRETGEVVIRCSVEEAMSVEATLATSSTDVPEIDQNTHAVWDGLDDLRMDLVKKHPNMISLELREFRDNIFQYMGPNSDGVT